MRLISPLIIAALWMFAPVWVLAQANPNDLEVEKRNLLKTIKKITEPSEKADKLNVLYKLCVKSKQFSDAQKYAGEELQLRLALPLDSTQNHKIANLHFGLASLSKSFNLFQQGIEHIDQALFFYQQLTVCLTSQLDLADAYRLASQIYFSSNQHQKAEQNAIQSLLILERYGEESGEKRLTALITLANIYSIQYKFDDSQNLLNRALLVQNQLFEQNKKSSNPEKKLLTEPNETTARIWQSFAKNYEYQGEYKLAADYLGRALSIRKNLYGDSPNLDLAYNMEHLALMEAQKLDFAQAKSLFNQSLSIYTQIYAEKHPKMAISWSGLANVFRKEKKLDSARVYFERGLSLYTSDLSTYGNSAAEISLSLAHLAMDRKDSISALKRVEQGLNFISKQSNINPKFSAAPALYLFGCEFANNSSQKWVYFNRWFDLICQSPQLKLLLNLDPQKIEKQYIGYKNPTDIREARKRFEQKIPVYQQIYLSALNKKQFISGLGIYIHFLTSEAEKKPQIQLLHEANECLELFYYCHQQFILGLQTERDKLMYLMTAEQIFLMGVEVNHILYSHERAKQDKTSANFYLEKALNYSEWAKSVLLQQYWRESQLFAANNQQFQAYKSRQYQLLYAEEQFKQNTANSEQADKNSIEFLSKSYDSLRAERQRMGINGRSEFQLNNALQSPYVLVIDDLEKNIIKKQNAAIIAYSGAAEGFYTFQFWDNKREWFYQGTKLDNLSQAFFANIALQEQEPGNAVLVKEYARLGFDLGKILLPNDLPARIKTVIISPQNSQNMLPLDALLSENPQGKDLSFRNMPYWVRKAAFSYVYNLQMLSNSDNNSAKKLTPNFKKANIFAFSPDYSLTTTSDELRAKLSKLAGAEQELAFLQKEYRGLFLRGEAANEARVKQEINKYDVIHFAGHALADMEYNWQSKLILNPTQDSNLAFANEGFLQMYEVAAMQLSARLVFLSACETGVGGYAAGEGVFSLGKSFFYAGVPAVVMSSWNVNDQNTFRLVTLFYRELSKGLDKNEALRQAKIAYLGGEIAHSDQLTDNPANPCFWAGFNLVGDISPLVLQPAPNVWVWTTAKIIGFGFAFFVFFWFVRNRKKN